MLNIVALVAIMLISFGQTAEAAESWADPVNGLQQKYQQWQDSMRGQNQAPASTAQQAMWEKFNRSDELDGPAPYVSVSSNQDAPLDAAVIIGARWAL